MCVRSFFFLVHILFTDDVICKLQLNYVSLTCYNGTFGSADNTSLTLSPLNIAVKPIITVANALIGAITCRTKSRYLSTVLSSPSSSAVEYVPPGGKNGLMQSRDLLSSEIIAAHSVSTTCQYRA